METQSTDRKVRMFRSRWQWILVLLCVVALLGTMLFHLRSVPVQTPSKLWSIDLGSDDDFRKRLATEEVLLRPPAIDFLNEAKIICSFHSGTMIGSGPSQVLKDFRVIETEPPQTNSRTKGTTRRSRGDATGDATSDRMRKLVMPDPFTVGDLFNPRIIGWTRFATQRSMRINSGTTPMSAALPAATEARRMVIPLRETHEFPVSNRPHFSLPEVT